MTILFLIDVFGWGGSDDLFKWSTFLGTCAVLVTGSERTLVANISAANNYSINHLERAVGSQICDPVSLYANNLAYEMKFTIFALPSPHTHSLSSSFSQAVYVQFFWYVFWVIASIIMLMSYQLGHLVSCRKGVILLHLKLFHHRVPTIYYEGSQACSWK